MKPYQIAFAIIMLLALSIKGYKMYAEHKRIPVESGMVWEGYYNIIKINHPPRYGEHDYVHPIYEENQICKLKNTVLKVTQDSITYERIDFGDNTIDTITGPYNETSKMFK
jgi:hypothetical protein